MKLCRFIGLHLIEHVPSVSTESVRSFIGRTDEAWMAIFRKLLSAKRATCVTALSNEEEMRKEMHRIYLLYAVFKRACGEANNFQQLFDGTRSANENLANLGDLLNIDTESAPGSDTKLAKFLVLGQFDLMLDSEPELSLVYRYVPIGFDVADQIPPQDLLNNLPYGPVSRCLHY